jgi:ubiquinone/menaquinone biosynthesis C-methylase UbiE
MQDFYREMVDDLLATGVLKTPMRILVVCGGQIDRAVLRKGGFQHVVISNVDPRPGEDEFAPFDWCYQDAERLTFEDGSFDFCIVHSGLHHCYSPHRALLEMYRVARTGLLLFEPYDNLTTRLGVKLNIGQAYEHASVFQNDYAYGGVGNSPIPNFIYRWTEQEIVKTINCYAPHARHEIRFIHKTRIPWTQLRGRRNKTLYHLVRLGQPALKLTELCFPKQSNNFAALVLKPQLPLALHPWLRQDGEALRLNDQWLAARYSRGSGPRKRTPAVDISSSNNPRHR